MNYFKWGGKNDRQKLEFLCFFPKTSTSHFFKVLKRLTRKLKTFGLSMTSSIFSSHFFAMTESKREY